MIAYTYTYGVDPIFHHGHGNREIVHVSVYEHFHTWKREVETAENAADREAIIVFVE